MPKYIPSLHIWSHGDFQPKSYNPKPQTQNPKAPKKLYTVNPEPKPETLNSKP